MIANPERTTLLSSLGWADHDSLWLYDVDARKAEAIPLDTGARYASLHAAGTHAFAVNHHFDGKRIEISVRSFSNPSHVVARAIIENGRGRLSGEDSAWQSVPCLYVAYLDFEPWKDFALVRVQHGSGKIDFLPLRWYDGSYDKMYQGVVDVIDLLDGEHALVSVQRSSRLVLHDLDSGNRVRWIHLCGRGGNPKLELRDSGREVWATDYDTLAIVNTADWELDRSSRLQDAAAGTQHFIGDYSFAPDEDLCLVARPFGGDVVGVDLRTLEIKCSTKLGRQPLEVAATGHGEVVARDWKTGDLLSGILERRDAG